MTCDRFRGAVLAADTAARALEADRLLAAHRDTCVACAAWMDAYAAGARAWEAESSDPPLGEVVLTRTLGSPCERAQFRAAAAWDDEPGMPATQALAAHLADCAECRHVAALLASVREGLPGLAELDPGPGFAASVLLRTSRRPARVTWADRVRAVGRTLLARPRFAWEAAYVLTLCWLLVFGNPITAFDWTTARVGAAAARDLPAPVQSAGARVQAWRARLSQGLVQVSSSMPDPRVIVIEAATGLQARSSAWVGRLTSVALEWLTAAWRAITDWVAGAFSEPLPAATEPGSAPVRSSK